MENKKKKRHFLSCPNCHDNLSKKRSQSVPFLKERVNVFLVQVCLDCLSNPDILDEERIFINLIGKRWPEEAAKKAARAVIEEARKRVPLSKPAPVEKMPLPTVAV
jgi:hypothetical protein